MSKQHPNNNEPFIKYNIDGFLKTDYKKAYAKVWFDPVQDYVIVVKDGIDKSLFPSKQHAIYNKEEMQFCSEMLQKMPKEAAYDQARKLHFVIKMFEGTMAESFYIDPDPSLSHTSDTRYWKRINDYAHTVVKNKGFIDSVKALRIKGFSIDADQKNYTMKFTKPHHISDLEAKKFFQSYIAPYFEHFKNVLRDIQDIKRG